MLSFDWTFNIELSTLLYGSERLRLAVHPATLLGLDGYIRFCLGTCVLAVDWCHRSILSLNDTNILT